MRIYRADNNGLSIGLSANDTYDWAHRPGGAWPCSTLSDTSLWAVLDSGGDLVDTNAGDVDAHELGACLADMLASAADQRWRPAAQRAQLARYAAEQAQRIA